MHGGKRNGAGRRPGSPTVKTSKVAKRLAEEGLTPLQVLMEVMRLHYDAKEFDKAASVAKDAAPYCHPRLQAITHKGDKDNPLVHQQIVGVNPEATVAAPEPSDEV